MLEEAAPQKAEWVYGGTCFRLSQRAKRAGGRASLLSHGDAMTRGGMDALKEQLWAEAMRHGLDRANEVLIVADGAVWIWNVAGDRCKDAKTNPERRAWNQGKACFGATETEQHKSGPLSGLSGLTGQGKGSRSVNESL
jgi:hypothetical protein